MKKKKTVLRGLVLDIETAPSIGMYFDLWKEGNIVKNVQDWYILSYAAKFLDEKKVYCKGLIDYKGYQKNKEDDKALCQDLADLISQADFIIAHNGRKFDIPKINARLIKHKIHPFPHLPIVDTYTEAKRHFKFTSNRLNDLAMYLGLGAKESTGGIDTWAGCMAGKKKSWDIMKKYNIMDVLIDEKVYYALLPWMRSHPNMTVFSCEDGCHNCGSTEIIKRGFLPTKTGKKQRYQCKKCGSWTQGPSEKTVTIG